MERIPTRMGDGSLVRMTRAEIEADIHAGVEAGAQARQGGAAAPRTRSPTSSTSSRAAPASAPSTSATRSSSARTASAARTSGRASTTCRTSSRPCAPTRSSCITTTTRSSRSSRCCRSSRRPCARRSSLLTIPCQYGAMPDLGRYTAPDGPVPNWSQLLPLGRIDEARAAQEEAVEHAVDDIVYVAEGMYEAGADGINLDTAGAAGDADFLAALKAIERIRARYPDWGIQIGMAGEFVLGMHGELEYDGVRLAGLWPADQMRLAAKAGVSVFGPAVNVNTGKTVAWNVARTCTICQAVHRRRRDPHPPQRRDGRGRRPHARAAAGRRRLARLARVRRHPAARRLVDRRRRQPQPGDRPRCRVGHGRIADRRRSGGPHADDPADAAPRGEGLRGRTSSA